MRILCDQMVKESFVSALEAEDRHTVACVRDLLAPDADDGTIAAYAVQHDWIIGGTGAIPRPSGRGYAPSVSDPFHRYRQGRIFHAKHSI